MTLPRRVLDGPTVLDAASWVARPVAATLMAAFGALVVEIEPPGPLRERRTPSVVNGREPISMSGQQKRQADPAPRLGEHTDEIHAEEDVTHTILLAAGDDAEALAGLRARKIVG